MENNIISCSMIVDDFEKNVLIPTSVYDWENNSEEISLYIAAKNYLKRHG